MFAPLFVQSLAILGLLVWTISYHFNNRKTILLVQLASFVFWILHFVLLGAMVGAVLSAIAAIRLALFSFKTKNNWIGSPFVMAFFIIVSIVGTYLTFVGYWSVFALIGGIFAIVASGQDNENRIRKLFIPSHISWIVYDIFAGSYGGALSEGILAISAIVSLYKNRRIHNK